jgi:hypothetical protein
MPTEEGIGLYNVQSLLPELGKSRKKDQAITNIIGQPWVLNLAVEDNQLLAQRSPRRPLTFSTFSWKVARTMASELTFRPVCILG